MAKDQLRSNRKVSGKRYVALRKKRLSDLGGIFSNTSIAPKRVKTKRAKGGIIKTSILSDENVYVTTDGKTSKQKIISVVNNPSNVNYTRRNIITKGCIVKTEKGDVRITSRPGQTGTLQGVLLK